MKILHIGRDLGQELSSINTSSNRMDHRFSDKYIGGESVCTHVVFTV